MQRSLVNGILLLLGAFVAFGAAAQPYGDDNDDGGTIADDNGDDGLGGLGGDEGEDTTAFVARLHGLNEVPSVSTPASGSFEADIDDASAMVTWRLTYENLEAPVEQAHIHLGQARTNGGVSAFLCSSLDDAPADVQSCPDGPAEVTGTIMAEQVVGPENQGISEGEFEELVSAIRARAAYVNVHSSMFPAGEVRGQLVPADDD